MGLVVTDTGPVNYLILIGYIEILPVLFERVVVPDAVRAELADTGAPFEVRKWISNPPVWIDLHPTLGPNFEADPVSRVHQGEREAIALAFQQRASLLLMDDRRGVDAAERMGLPVTGTLGLLEVAAQHHLLSLAEAFASLRRTNFRCPDDIMERLLARHKDSV